MSDQVQLRTALGADEAAALDALALATESYASRGSAFGSPSWRALLRRIAQGDLAIADPKTGAFYIANGGSNNERVRRLIAGA